MSKIRYVHVLIHTYSHTTNSRPASTGSSSRRFSRSYNSTSGDARSPRSSLSTASPNQSCHPLSVHSRRPGYGGCSRYSSRCHGDEHDAGGVSSVATSAKEFTDRDVNYGEEGVVYAEDNMVDEELFQNGEITQNSHDNIEYTKYRFIYI